jgi:hypothetical protein
MARPERPGLAETLEIRGGGWPPYTLRLRLLESEALDGDAGTDPGSINPGREPSGSGNAQEEGIRIP